MGSFCSVSWALSASWVYVNKGFVYAGKERTKKGTIPSRKLPLLILRHRLWNHLRLSQALVLSDTAAHGKRNRPSTWNKLQSVRLLLPAGAVTCNVFKDIGPLLGCPGYPTHGLQTFHPVLNKLKEYPQQSGLTLGKPSKEKSASPREAQEPWGIVFRNLDLWETKRSKNREPSGNFRKPPPKWNASFFPDFHVGTLHVYRETMIKPKSFGNRLPNGTLPSSQISMLEPYMSIVKPWLSQNLSETASQMERFLLPRFPCWNLTCLSWNHD